MNYKKKTIYALSTGRGKSAIAIIRLSGELSYGCVQSISTSMPKNSHTATFNELKTDNNELIDQTITTFFKAPRSFTGEDMVEISIHGSDAVIKKIFEIFSTKKNIRLAKPGEFTRRAFENNKLDLTQVEAISDIVNSQTEMQRKQAVSHLSGNFFKSSKKIFENLKKILANIEAFIDFSEEDLPDSLMNDVKEQIENIIIEINTILQGSKTGMSIRNGFVVAILGKPNTGKSSFVNNVSDKEVSIVTNEPGTTRDLIESFIDIHGYPIKFVDSAGIRSSSNIVEKIGVEKAFLLSQESDINIFFIDKIEDIAEFKGTKNSIYVKSKQDISNKSFQDKGYFNISSKTSFGIESLLLVIKNIIDKKTPYENQYISRERHVECLNLTVGFLKNSQNNKNIDVFAEDIRLALKNLSNLFGNVDIEDILDIIFSDFCIGK